MFYIQKGTYDAEGKMKNLGDAFSVFTQLKGSGKYWQKAKFELVAKVKQLGPFHIFFTLSCAEMRWPEVYVSIFRKMGKKNKGLVNYLAQCTKKIWG